ncbi:MAG TPA: hypothetical protein VFG23_01910 [Polyangia bacterium]|nr:hypothetical protein [Polyangia bacterium]
MSKAIVVHEESSAVKSRLAELGVPDEQMLRDAVAEGEVTRASFHKNVPGMAVGCAKWGTIVGGVRTRLVPHGWISSGRGHLEETLNPETKVSIVVSTGDDVTGVNGDADPKTKYPKGMATKEAIKQNNAQLDLWSRLYPGDPAYMPGFKPDISPAVTANDAGTAADSDGIMTWVLLVVRTDDEIRCELSLPYGIGIDNVVESWAERIILKPIPLDGSSKVEVVPVEPTPEIDVLVTRRKL